MLALLAATAAYIEGVVKVELTVEADGKVIACTVLESNMPAESDDLTCQGLLESGRFDATGDGTPIPVKRVVTVRYQVPVEAIDRARR